MAILKAISIFSLPLLFAGCCEDFTPDIDTRPVLCINSMITAGLPIEVRVSHTWPFTDGENKDSSVSDASVRVYANDEQVGSDYIPREGDHIRITAESLTYGGAEAEVVVPHAVQVESVEWKAAPADVWIGNTEGWKMLCDMSFGVSADVMIRDSADTDDYYRFSYTPFHDTEQINDPDEYDSPDLYFSPGSFQYDAEPIFTEHIDAFESVMGGDASGFTFFTDRQFSGSTYTLHLRFVNCRYFVRSQSWDEEKLDCGMTLTLHAISRSCYNWFVYLWNRDAGIQGDLSDYGFGEPMWGYSNVSTGAGVVAAQTLTTVTVNLHDFLESVMKE